MLRSSLFLRSTLLLFALTGASLFALPQTASAVGCQGGDCTGKSPVTEGCDTDAMLIEEYDEGTSISLKYFRSPACDASWAKVTLDFEETGLQPRSVSLFYVPQLGGSETLLSGGWVETGGTNPVFAAPTPMIGGDALAKGCFSDLDLAQDPAPETWTQSGTNGACTQWH
ncbi:DUF2690 domain-containing protein [Streptomyces sp. NPDC005374]|uniref:DUF2690 domain-containing protein n=1 Tax=Streptomyces sp. NPDC005374 TaxID=3364713 RepID=UPI0036B575CC